MCLSRAVCLMASFQAASVHLLFALLWQRGMPTFESDSRTALCGELELRVENVQGLLPPPLPFFLEDASTVLPLSLQPMH